MGSCVEGALGDQTALPGLWTWQVSSANFPLAPVQASSQPGAFALQLRF